MAVAGIRCKNLLKILLLRRLLRAVRLLRVAVLNSVAGIGQRAFCPTPGLSSLVLCNASLAAFAEESRIDSWIRAQLGDSAATFCPSGEP